MNLSKFQFGYGKHGIIDCIKNKKYYISILIEWRGSSVG